MSFSASDEVIVSINKNVQQGSCMAVVVRVEESCIQLALRGTGVLVKNGMLLHVQSLSNPNLSAWGSVEQIGLAGDVKLISLKSVCYETKGKVRAARCQIDVGLNVHFNDRNQHTKRTIGQTVNISVSGVRARFRTTIPEGTLLHVLLHLEGGAIVEAVARVARIVEGSQSASGGYEAGLEFQRFIRGYENLLEMVPSGDEYPPNEEAAA